MNKPTLRKWTRDALETIHQLKYETNDASVLAKRHAHRVIALTDAMISANIPDQAGISAREK